MKTASSEKLTRFILTLMVLCLPGVASAQLSFNSIVVFGTSVSDPGNAYALLAQPQAGLAYDCSVTLSLPPYQSVVDEGLYPCAPYAIGGHHFSDGSTWIEQFATARGCAADVEPAFLSTSSKAHNYAVGGARAVTYSGRVNLPQQVQVYLAAVGQSAPSDALYVIEIGNNDTLAMVRDLSGIKGTRDKALLFIGCAFRRSELGRRFDLSALSYLQRRARKALLRNEKASIKKSFVTLGDRLNAFFGEKLETHFGLGHQLAGPSCQEQWTNTPILITW